MKRTLIDKIPIALPDELYRYIEGADIYDSSCSPEARVYFVDKDGGCFVKVAEQGTLEREALMTGYFHKKGLGTEVLSYHSGERDILFTAAVRGEDCTHYLDDPRRLSVLIAEQLRSLHEVEFSDCPIKDRMSEYFALAEKNYRTDSYDKSHFPDSFGYRSAEEAYAVMREGRGELKSDVLLHGDYCLPNVMLDDWRFSGFIDLGNGGVGDRHVDLFWGAWTLAFNLGTDEYRSRFFDAYGRDVIDGDKLRTVAAAEVFG